MTEWVFWERVLAVVAGIVAAVLAAKGLAEFKHSVEERGRELRWKKAETAKQLIDAIRSNAASSAALKMLDWWGAEFVKPDGQRTRPLTHPERRRLLRTHDTTFDELTEPDAIFVRDCFDRLMEDISLINNYIKIQLIEFADIEPYFSYYIGLTLKEEEKDVLQKFALAYGYPAFLTFQGRFVAEGLADDLPEG